jgi:hypothetical protein
MFQVKNDLTKLKSHEKGTLIKKGGILSKEYQRR